MLPIMTPTMQLNHNINMACNPTYQLDQRMHEDRMGITNLHHKEENPLYKTVFELRQKREHYHHKPEPILSFIEKPVRPYIKPEPLSLLSDY